MSHEIANTNGRPAMAFFGATPWHGLGTRLDQPATAEEALAASGLNYEVELEPIYTRDGTLISRRKAVVRNDCRDVLGVVGNSYVPVQNRDGFEFLDSVVSEGKLEYHTAGALGKGERVWMLAKLPGNIRVLGSEDITEKYLLLSNAHDGSAALRVFFTPIRVVCANTLSMAHRRGVGKGISILHKGDLTAKVHEAQKVLGLATCFYHDVQVKADHLAGFKPTTQQIDNYFRSLIPDPKVGNTSRAENMRRQLWQLFEEGRGQKIPEIQFSAWAAFNALTEFVDHHRPTRGQSEAERAGNRLQSQWFGSGATLKSQAWELALSMAS
jgi:phage/plasmid-like protein (TIGR03299 family)